MLPLVLLAAFPHVITAPVPATTPTPAPPPLVTTGCNAVPPTKGLVDPPEVRSKDGVLAVTLHLRGSNDPANLLGLCWWHDTGNGGQQTWVPPTLHIKQGDEIRLTLVNELVRPPTSMRPHNGGAATHRMSAMGDMSGMSMSRDGNKDPYGLMCGQVPDAPTPTPDPVTGRIYGYHRTPWNETNMHFHGLNVSPKMPSDDVVTVMLCPRKSPADPPKSFTYVIDVPRDEPPGTYWYHPHAHGESERQVLSQLTGAIVIDPLVAGPPQQMRNRLIIVRDLGSPGSIPPRYTPAARALRKHSPSLAAIRADVTKHGYPNPDHQPLFRFGPPQACPSASKPWTPKINTKQLWINNIPLPIWGNRLSDLPYTTMQLGSTEYWRLANTAADTILDVEAFVNGKRMPIQVVTRDGVPLVTSNGQPTYQPVPMDHVRLSPASRMDFYLQASEPGRIVLRTRAIDSGCLGDIANERDLLVIHVPNSASMPTRLQAPRAVDPVKMRFSDLATQRPVRHRYFVFTEYNRDDEPIPDWYITELSNKKAVEHPYRMHGPPDVTVKSGTVEDWTILNYTQELHEFHIHQIHFYVMGANGIAFGQHQMLDTVEVPYGAFVGSASQQFVPGGVTLRMDFRDPRIIGTFVYHCHILSHEDNGMMARIKVAP